METMKLMDMTICVIDPTGPWLWNLYPDIDSAYKKCYELNNELLDKDEQGRYFVGNCEQFKQMQKEKHLTGIIHKSTESEFWEMIEVLPPLNWQRGTVETFCMSEFMVGPYTSQYGCYNGQYVSKMVDYYDPSTYIKAEDFKNAV